MLTTLLMLPGGLRKMLLADCELRRPDEACGMLVGVTTAAGIVVQSAVPLTNVWPVVTERPTRYTVDPLEQLRAERQATADGHDVVGFYHSHPSGQPVPSTVDVEMAWPGYCYLIVGFAPAARFAAWVLDTDGTRFLECRIESAD